MAVSKEGWCRRLCTPKFMATAPAAALPMHTRASVTMQATLRSHDRAKLAFSRRLGLIGCHRGQHVLLGPGGIVGGGILLCHYGFGGEAGGVVTFVRDEIAAERRQGEERGEDQSPPEGEIEGEEAGKRGHGLAVSHLTHHARMKSGRRRHFRLHFERVEPLGELLHAGHFVAARRAVAQVRLDIAESRRLQRAGQVLLEALHYYRMHKLLPCKERKYHVS